MQKLKRVVSYLFVSLFIFNSSFAGFINIDSEAIIGTNSEVRDEITSVLESKEMIAELAKLGVSKQEVELRLAAMTDKELLQVKQGVERQAGGDVVIISSGLLLLILILVLIFK